MALETSIKPTTHQMEKKSSKFIAYQSDWHKNQGNIQRTMEKEVNIYCVSIKSPYTSPSPLISIYTIILKLVMVSCTLHFAL
jgi:hypothetical protein